MPVVLQHPPSQALRFLDSLCSQGRLPELVAQLQALLLRYPGAGVLHLRLGNAYAALGRFGPARESFENAIRWAPGDAGIHYNLGNTLRVLGDFEGAAESYARAIQLSPDFAAAHFNLSSLRTYRPGDPQIKLMRAQLKRRDLPKSAEMALHFALGKAHSDCDDPDRAFAHFVQGNRAQRAIKPYDAAGQRRLFADIRACFEAGIDAVPQPPAGPAQPQRPVFIVGMLRSGSTLVEQILGRHSQVHAAGEIGLASASARQHLGPAPGAITAARMGAFRDAYRAGLSRLRASAPVITDKMPHNFLWTGFLLRAFPEARIVHMVRDPRATCWSIFSHCFPTPEGGYDNDLRDLTEFHGLYADLMAFWHRLFPGQILDLQYESLVEAPEAETRRLLAHCGLAWEPGCLADRRLSGPLLTASGPQVAKPIYRGSSDAWRKFAPHLGSMLEGLAPSLLAPPSPPVPPLVPATAA
jgi:tetratricopeptide (TPR) repeat protein